MSISAWLPIIVVYYCKLIGHVEKCCIKKFPQRHKEEMNRLKKKQNPHGMRRTNYIEESDDEKESEEDEEQLVLGRRRQRALLHGRDDVRKLF